MSEMSPFEINMLKLIERQTEAMEKMVDKISLQNEILRCFFVTGVKTINHDMHYYDDASVSSIVKKWAQDAEKNELRFSSGEQ